MLFPTRMAKVRVVILSRSREEVVRRLHELGVTQFISFIDEYRGTGVGELVEMDSPGELLRDCVGLSLRIGHVIDAFSAVEGTLAASRPKPREIPYATPDELVKAAESRLSEVEGVLNDVEDRLGKLKFEEDRLARVLDLSETLKPLGVDLDLLRGGPLTYTTVGKIPPQSVARATGEMFEATDGRVVWKAVVVDGESLLFVTMLSRDREKVSSILRQYDFTHVEVPEAEGAVDEVLSGTKSSLEKLRVEREGLYKTLQDLSKAHREDLLVLRELLELEREREEVRRFLVRTRNTVVFEGWVPEKDVGKLTGVLDETANGMYVLSKLESHGNPTDPPTLLENPEPVRSFEMLTEMYGSPNYREIDPTPLLMFSFLTFFGVCYADAGYAVLLAIASLVMLTKFRMSEDYRRLGVVVLLQSVAAFIVGVLSGSFFGDLFRIRPHIVQPLTNPIAWLVGSLEIGIAHLFIGYGVGAWIYLRRGDVIAAVFGQISQILFMVGGIVFTISFFKLMPISESVVLMAKILVVTGVVFIFFRTGIPNDVGAVVRGIPTWVLSIYGMVSGILGNVFSYSRLMALCLSGAGLAMVMNLMAGMVWGVPIVGPILFTLILVFGHLYNASISSVGSFVHSLRLNFYEFFGTFYQGDGSKFAPFRARRSLTKLTEVKR